MRDRADIARRISTSLGWLLLTAAFLTIVVVPLDLQQQLLFSLGCFLIALLLFRRKGRLPALMLMALSVVVSSRYMYWRLTETMHMAQPLDLILGTGLLLAEIYAFVTLVLGYFQVLWPLGRKPLPLPDDVRDWPSVDVFIPTYDEDLSIVRTTVLAAQALDWPADRLSIHVLDDGRRQEFRRFCEEAGVHYHVRADNRHAKAGNLNAALARTQGDYVAIFDSDHVPTRSFLQMTLGWFLADPKLGMLQTPHHFFSADPLERNLGTFGKVPNEGELFYGLLQDGNDLWNATFFCGSCAVLSRKALEAVGGVAVETVTEDAHTALKMHRLGYTTAYIAIPQAAGLATESLSAHVGQRIRWARGMAQILRTDNPFSGKGLTLPQRLAYLNAMLHFFYGLPRLVFLTSPLAFLFLDAHIIFAPAVMIAAFALPHLLHAFLTNSRVQGRFRHLFWNEVYESVLAWYILRPTLVALFSPKRGKFNVTAKGGLIEQSYFDTSIAKPYLILLALNLAGLVVGVVRLYWGQGGEIATIWLNLGWTFYNIVILGAAVAAASERRQLRKAHRVKMSVPAALYCAGGRSMVCQTRDFSTGGLGLELPREEVVQVGDSVEVTLTRDAREMRLPATVVTVRERRIGLSFEGLTLAQEAWLIACTFSRADAWTQDWGRHPGDAPVRALLHIYSVSLIGLYRLGRYLRRDLRRRVGRQSSKPATSPPTP